jgi:hypothetical protein
LSRHVAPRGARKVPRIPLAAGLSLAVATVALAVFGAVASALPGDPPITTISPPSGATLPADDLGLEVTFSCPAYTKDVEGEGEDEKKQPGTTDDYGVHFSTSPAIGHDRLLTTAGFGDDDGEGSVDLAAAKSTCSSELQLPDKPIPADLYRGTIYWQAYRACEGCSPGEYEAGPVNSIVLTPNVELPELTLEPHVYVDYLTKVEFSTASDLTGATFVLQRHTKQGWSEVQSLPAESSGEASFFPKLPSGKTQLRVLVIAPGFELGLEPQKLTVRKPGGKSSVDESDDGLYEVAKAERAKAPAHFEVDDDGKLLAGLRATVPATCRSGSASVPATARVALKRARIAPDGTVVARTTAKGATPAHMTLAGNLHDRHFSGELTIAYLNCTGSRDFEADLAEP